MKLIIDIPYGHYCTIEDGFLSECLKATTEAILNGTPIPDDATNGDIIKALFPKIDDNFSNVIDLKLWWNAKYKAKSEDKK